jgi:hypothetical protein
MNQLGIPDRYRPLFSEDQKVFDFSVISRFPTKTCLDVGANAGAWTAALLKQGADKVYTFEPIPALYEVLRRRFDQNPRVVLSQLAMSDRTDIIKDCKVYNCWTLVVDQPDGCVFIVDHPSYVDDQDGGIKLSRNFCAVETYGIVRCAIELNELVANKHPIEQRHLDIIDRETRKYRGFSIFDDANAERLAIWKNTPTFDLVEQRRGIRSSQLWRW